MALTSERNCNVGNRATRHIIYNYFSISSARDTTTKQSIRLELEATSLWCWAQYERWRPGWTAAVQCQKSGMDVGDFLYSYWKPEHLVFPEGLSTMGRVLLKITPVACIISSVLIFILCIDYKYTTYISAYHITRLLYVHTRCQYQGFRKMRLLRISGRQIKAQGKFP